MSCHILQQFDEALLEEITRPNTGVQSSQLREALNQRRRRRLPERIFGRLQIRELIIIAAAIILTLASLSYSVQAGRKTARLQQQLQLMESRIGEQGPK